FTYTPAANYNGSDSFTFKANDGQADSNVATESITVIPVNDAPLAANGSAATNEDTALNGNATATDVDGDTLASSLVAGPAHGTRPLNSSASFTYPPGPTYTGPHSFPYKATDGRVDPSTATFAITVNPVNDAPVAADDSTATDEDSAVTIAVVANDTDA